MVETVAPFIGAALFFGFMLFISMVGLAGSGERDPGGYAGVLAGFVLGLLLTVLGTIAAMNGVRPRVTEWGQSYTVGEGEKARRHPSVMTYKGVEYGVSKIIRVDLSDD